MNDLPLLAEEFRARLESASSVLVVSHLNPDGDAIGSSLAVSFYLDQLGIKHEVLNQNESPLNLRWMPGIDRLKTETRRKHEVAVVLDLNTFDRLGRVHDAVMATDSILLVDHHVPQDEIGDLRIVDQTAPATALILYRLFKQLGAEFTPKLATALLTGVVTDTGSFRFRNTTPEALTMAADLLAHGGELNRINEEVFGKRTLEGVLLMRKALDNMQLLRDNRLAMSVLRAEDFASIGAIENNTEGLVNELLSIDTAQIAVLLRQPSPERKVRASVRSREPFDVATALRPLGGGGHRNAAGVTFEVDIDTAEEQLVEVLSACLAASS
ncbi:MAG: bifunctional oligoribonuclease/PAP phosphatase NrnA [Chthonomonas sp.]|nr:bifunctional oligoribonuclease/PAP phosphatase NrnA [Chthonomonas sp.]